MSNRFTLIILAALLMINSSPAAEPGLIVEFEGGGVTDVRSARLAALYVPAKGAPTPMIAPGAFRATMSGNLEMKIRDELSFSLVGRGSAKLSINGQKILELSGDSWRHEPTQAIQLKKGKNQLVINYASPQSGDAYFRLYWTSSEFPPEPIPPTAFSHEPNEALASAVRMREGRALFANLRCFQCHQDESLRPAIELAKGAMTAEFSSQMLEKLPMPELAIDAPDLAGVGSRLNEAWMAAWIADPKKLRPQATMPKLLDEGKAVDVAAYLATLTSEDQKPFASNDEAIAAGGRLFAHRHCIACHTLPDSEKIDAENDRVPLAYVGAKYKPAVLKSFLQNPNQHYAWIRMPNFKFTEVEAERLAAFLLSKAKKAIDAPAKKGDAAKGKELIASAGCLNCHSVPQKTPSSLKAPTLAKLDAGCLAPEVKAPAPQFNFNPPQREALAIFLKSDRSSLKRDSMSEFAERQISHLRCTACHSRDATDELWTTFDEEVAPLVADGVEDEPPGEGDERIAEDQSEPMLTWAGEKLKPQWTTLLLRGQVDYRLRPWLRARMPAFPARAMLLAHGLPLEHGFPPLAPPDPSPEQELVPIGRKLLAKDGGFACTTCHGAGSLKPVGVFEAPGPNLQYTNERLTEHYFKRWVYNPLRVHKDTKMPAFADTAGKTSLRETLEGDARKQYEAIYQYLLAGRKIDPPEN